MMRTFESLPILMMTFGVVWSGVVTADSRDIMAADIAPAATAFKTPASPCLPGARPAAVVVPNPVENLTDVLLHDNGPFITAIGAGTNGSNISAAQTAFGMTTLGYGFAKASNLRVADDFTIPPGDPWQITTITIYGYQTGSGTLSTFTGANVRIWNQIPSNPAATVVFGNINSNYMTTSAFVNVYRIFDTTPTANTRPIMGTVLSVPVTLPAGTYWLDMQADGSLASGPWAVPITIIGTSNTGNGIQYTTAWAPVVDVGVAMPQGFPFKIYGVPEPSLGMSIIAPALLAGVRGRRTAPRGN